MNVWKTIKGLFDTPPRHSVEHRLREVKPRKVRRYNAARRSGGDLAGWLTSNTSINLDIWSSIKILRARSRDLLRNSDYARGVIGKLVDNVIYEGVNFQSQVKQVKDSEKNDVKVNQLIESNFKKWAEQPKWCHTAGKLDYNDIQRLVFRSLLESGEVFIRKVTKSFSGSPVPYALEVIEADQLAEEKQGLYNDNIIAMGIEIDSWQRPVAYWFYKSHPGEQIPLKKGYQEIERVPASQIIHLHFSDRPGQSRGIPLLFSTIIRLKNTNDYEENELIAAKLSSCLMGIITSPYSDLLPEPPEQKKGDDLPADEQMKPGVFRHLATGESFDLLNPNRPNPNLVTFIEQQLRGVAAGIGVSYETVSSDYSKTNYSSSRLSLLTARDRYKVLQRWFANNFLREVIYGNPDSDGWIHYAVLSGVLKFNDFELRSERYFNLKWQFRGYSWVDPDKEVKAIIKQLGSGMTTLTDYYAEQGKDVDEQLKILARERKLIEDLELDLNFIVNENVLETTDVNA